MQTRSRLDRDERTQILRHVLVDQAILLELDVEIALYEVNFDHCNLRIKNIIDEEGNLSLHPHVVYEIRTYDGAVFEHPLLEVDPGVDLIELYTEIIGEVELYW